MGTSCLVTGTKGILSAGTLSSPFLEGSEFFHFAPGGPSHCLEGPGKGGPENLLSAPSPFGPHFQAGFVPNSGPRQGSPHEGPRPGPRLPAHVRAIPPPPCHGPAVPPILVADDGN